MKVNGKERNVSDMTQWEQVRMHDMSHVEGEIGLNAEVCAERQEEILETLQKQPDLENSSISPLTDRHGNTYQLSPREYAETLGRRAVAMRGISYAGEMPA